MNETDETESIDLPAETFSQIQKRVYHMEFNDVNEYVIHVLQEVLYHVEQENDVSDAEGIDDQQVEERLRSLGYLKDE